MFCEHTDILHTHTHKERTMSLKAFIFEALQEQTPHYIPDSSFCIAGLSQNSGSFRSSEVPPFCSLKKEELKNTWKKKKTQQQIKTIPSWMRGKSG